MIAVHYRLAVGHIGNTVNNHVAGCRIVRLEHHPRLHFNRKNADILDTHQLRIMFAESIVRRQHHIHRIAYLFTVQRLFHQRENAVVTAVQVHNRFFRFIQQLIVGIKHFIVKRYRRIFSNSHFRQTPESAF